jgi:choline dehydrogenase
MRSDANGYDYIIVGGGSAGSALANRLSAGGSNRVLVLEAGHKDVRLDYPVRVPAAMLLVMGNPLYDWRYRSEPEPRLGNREIAHYRGKVVGGSSSINGMFYQRANPLTFDRWARERGLEQWDYAHCLPYFKRMETAVAAAVGDPYRGHSGPLIVERSPATNPLFGAFFEAAQQAGHEIVDDVNGYRQEGFSRFERNIHKGERVSASRAYLHPVLRRPNLELRTRSLVTRIVFEGTSAVGVEVASRRGRTTIERGGEIILCGGAFNSPQLLQLSGVGNGTDLRQLGVAVVHDLPGVGENLVDHLEAFVMYGCRQPVSLAPALRKRAWPRIGAEWFLRRTGIAATNHFEAGGFVRTNDAVELPNMMMTFLPLGVRNDGTPAPTEHAYQINLAPQTPTSVGSLKLRSSDPHVPPVLTFNYLSTEQDRHEWVEGVRATRDILNQPAFAPFNDGELSPGPTVESDDAILDWVARDAETSYHPCGTCRMGLGPESVVDPGSMKVHGIEGVRVVDASVFPRIPNANLFAPVMMVAEKSADLILGNTPLAPEPLDYYQHPLAMAAGGKSVSRTAEPAR